MSAVDTSGFTTILGSIAITNGIRIFTSYHSSCGREALCQALIDCLYYGKFQECEHEPIIFLVFVKTTPCYLRKMVSPYFRIV